MWCFWSDPSGCRTSATIAKYYRKKKLFLFHKCSFNIKWLSVLNCFIIKLYLSFKSLLHLRQLSILSILLLTHNTILFDLCICDIELPTEIYFLVHHRLLRIQHGQLQQGTTSTFRHCRTESSYLQKISDLTFHFGSHFGTVTFYTFLWLFQLHCIQHPYGHISFLL